MTLEQAIKAINESPGEVIQLATDGWERMIVRDRLLVATSATASILGLRPGSITLFQSRAAIDDASSRRRIEVGLASGDENSALVIAVFGDSGEITSEGLTRLGFDADSATFKGAQTAANALDFRRTSRRGHASAS